MKKLGCCLGDPSLHLLAIALLLVYLAIGAPASGPAAESRLVSCRKCRAVHFPEGSCTLASQPRISGLRPLAEGGR